MNGDNVNEGLLSLQIIADRLRLRLNSSDFDIGSPTERKSWRKRFGVARMTIRKTINLLVSWGWWCVGTARYPMSPARPHETSQSNRTGEVLRKHRQGWSARYWFYEDDTRAPGYRQPADTKLMNGSALLAPNFTMSMANR